MTTQNVVGALRCADGSTIQLSGSVTDATVVNGSGSATEIQTDAAWTGVAQSVGDFAAGKAVTSAIITSKTFCEFAYVLRNGQVWAILPTASRSAGGSGAYGDLPLCAAWQIIPGDKVYVATLA
jgi:hypothetical protein